MAYFSLNYTVKVYLLALSILIVIALLVALIINMAGKKSGFRLATLACMLLIGIVYAAALMEINNRLIFAKEIPLSEITVLIGNIPYPVHIIWCVGAMAFCVYSVYKMYKSNKNAINNFSIKEALENLPAGIVFLSDNNELYLSNNIIHGLCKEITGKVLQSGKVFWADLLGLCDKEFCVIKGQTPAFALENGEVWQFSKTLCKWKAEAYTQIKAVNITQLYNLGQNTKKVNEKLYEQHGRLKALTDFVEKNAQEQVAVNMKVNFHDNFGNLLALTKKTLRENPDIDTTKEIAKYWEDLSGIITDLTSDEIASLCIEQIVLFGDKLGCKVVVEGAIPEEEKYRQISLLCINEMLKNAYRHAGADRLDVKINQDDDKINISIHNEDKYLHEKIEEGGGLLGIRQKIENAGGQMEMICGDGVTMLVDFVIEK